MITEADVATIDQAKLHRIYEMWPEHFAKASRIPVKNTDHAPDFYKLVLLCGMGGSATSSDILNDMLLHDSKVPAVVLRGEQLPSSTSKHTLVIVNSVSGNTKESVKMMEEASDRGAEVICISSGGLLKELCDKRGHTHIDIPSFSLPRASLPYMIMPGLKLIDKFLEHTLKNEVSAIPQELSSIKRQISASNSRESNIAKKMASFFESGFAFCFSSPNLASVGTRFKNSLNENAKVHCLTESVLEASHNEIVPFTFNNNAEINPKVMLLQWKYDQGIIEERFRKISSFFSDMGQAIMTMIAPQKSLVNAIISSIYTLDYATIYMAVTRRIDPSPTPAIDILKALEMDSGNTKVRNSSN